MNKRSELLELEKVWMTERTALLSYACYKLGNMADAEDVVQDCYLKLYKRFSEEQNPIVTNMKYYVFRTMLNLCSSRLSLNSKIQTIPLENFDVIDTPSDNHEEEYIPIIKLLDKIPKEQAEVIRLRIYGCCSFMEISEILQVPLPTVKSRFLYGLEKIRKEIKSASFFNK